MRNKFLALAVGLIGITTQAQAGSPIPLPEPVTNELTCHFELDQTAFNVTVQAPGAAVSPTKGDGLLTVASKEGALLLEKHFFASRRYEVAHTGELVFTYFESSTRRGNGLQIQIRDHAEVVPPVPAKGLANGVRSPIPPQAVTTAYLSDPSVRLRGSVQGSCYKFNPLTPPVP